jgi:phosphate-selective porin OprO/OprP
MDFAMLHRFVLKSVAAAAVLAVFGLSSACSQQFFELAAFDKEINSQADSQNVYRRIDQLEDEVRKLREQSSTQNTSLEADGDGKKPDAKKSADGEYVIGSDLSVKTEFKNGMFLWLSTPHNDFTMHLGGWLQLDNVWWDQSEVLKTPPDGRPGHAQGVASGAPQGGIGDLQDGIFFRRIRPFAEGTLWENGEYRLILALENDQFNTSGLDEFWVGAKDLPWVGSVRFGHVKNAMGLEGDMVTSSRAMTFMERSAYSEAIELNQNFVTGLWFSDNYFDQRMTWALAVFRPDLGSSSGVFFGDGQDGVQARLTGLPVYENDGRDLLHLGMSGGYRTGTSNDAVSPFHVFQLRARPELRDDVPAGTGVTNSDSNRFIDTGVIAADNDWLLGLEALWIRGPFSFQAEYGWNFLNGAFGVAPTGTTLHPPIVPPQNYIFNGGYLQVAYTLTGENRAYDRRMGALAREYYGKSGPFSNSFLIRDEDGHVHCGWGAWEVAARYSYVDLNDGTGLNRIQGGILNGVSLAVNWYANNNFNIMCDWVYDQRSDLAPGSLTGWTSGFGIEAQFQF